MADEQHGFCIEGDIQPFCKELKFFELPDEKDIIVLILEYFKRFLPQVLKRKTDYYNKPINFNIIINILIKIFVVKILDPYNSPLYKFCALHRMGISLHLHNFLILFRIKKINKIFFI